MEGTTMKKYIKPICETIELNVKSGILAGSGPAVSGSTSDVNDLLGREEYGDDW